jgi:hypothetical protein
MPTTLPRWAAAALAGVALLCGSLVRLADAPSVLGPAPHATAVRAVLAGGGDSEAPLARAAAASASGAPAARASPSASIVRETPSDAAPASSGASAAAASGSPSQAAGAASAPGSPSTSSAPGSPSTSTAPGSPPSTTASSSAPGSSRTPAASGAAAQALQRQRRIVATFTPLPVSATAGVLAPPEAPFLDACVDGRGFDVEGDARCYAQLERRTLQLQARDPHAAHCWGFSGRDGASEPLLFHTLVLNRVGPQAPLLLWSFLATQCCDAVLWFWLAPDAARNMSAPPIALPPHMAHRVVFKPFDAAAEWAAVAGDFPAANETALAALNGFSDVRYVSDWARQVLLYRHGGVWVDIDTVFLQDWRPLFAFVPFAYRAGFTILINNAVLRLGKRPNVITQEVMAAAIAKLDPRPDAIFYTLGYARAGTPEHFHYLREGLFDFLWYRFVRAETDAMKGVHPELAKHWHDFFTPAASDAELARRVAAPFMAGSYSYHWHNRYDRGLPERAWAGVLTARFRRWAADKAGVCAPRGGGAG